MKSSKAYLIFCASVIVLSACSNKENDSSVSSAETQGTTTTFSSLVTAQLQDNNDSVIEDDFEKSESIAQTTTTYKSLVTQPSSSEDSSDIGSVIASDTAVPKNTDLIIARYSDKTVEFMMGKLGAWDLNGKLSSKTTKDSICDALGADLKAMKQDYTQDVSLEKSYLYSWITITPEQWGSKEIFGGYTRVYDSQGTFLRLKLCEQAQDDSCTGFDSYVPRSKTVNYFCVQFQDAGGGWVFVPLVSGTDEDGYYLVADTQSIYNSDLDIAKPDNLF